jgi:hypothetical protein
MKAITKAEASFKGLKLVAYTGALHMYKFTSKLTKSSTLIQHTETSVLCQLSHITKILTNKMSVPT